MRTAKKDAARSRPPSVAMLSWEINPMVAGGSWTACYHFVRSLRKRGAKLMVVAPWSEDCVDPDPFGCDVPTALLGILSDDTGSGIGFAAKIGSYRKKPAGTSRYGVYRQYEPSIYGGASYGKDRPIKPSRYGGAPYRPAGGATGFGGYVVAGKNPDAETFFHFMRKASDRYTEKLLDLGRMTHFTQIHAQDWITFQAATEVSRTFDIPWIAHFHSLERDRSPLAPDSEVERIERDAAHAADAVVTPSRLTARRVAEYYEVPLSKIVVVPNVLSKCSERPARGKLASRRVVFLGRLELQKAPDRFARVAARVHARDCRAVFEMFGDGQLRDELARDDPLLKIRGPLSWNRRWSAFDGAAALLVPSRAEPFGMVVLEAMQCGVPVLYTNKAGVAEVVGSGLPIEAGDIGATADRVIELLGDREFWEGVVEGQRREINLYPERGYENRLLELYAGLEI
jgi:glycosyltransferase involved in cell wall biosynthesis